MQELPQESLDALDAISGEIAISKIDYDRLTPEDLFSETLYDTILSLDDELKINQAVALCGTRARKLNIKSDFDKCYKAYINQITRLQYADAAAGSVTTFAEQPLTLLCGAWTADDAGVRKCKRTPDGGSTWDVASPIPIMPTELYENIDTGTEKIRIAFYKNDSWRSLVCERVTVASNVKIIELANVGIEVTSESAKFLVKYISEMVALNMGVIPRYKSTSHLGWIKKDFMPYDTNVKFDGETENKHIFEAVSAAGDYSIWLEHIKELRKNQIFRIALDTAFAAPLIRSVGALPFITHLWGGTGVGKTVVLTAAASIWGNPASGKMLRTLNMTEYAMLSASAFLGDICFVGDELQTVKTKWDNFDKLIMTLCEGQDRARMSFNKSLPVGNWSCSYLFSGEEPITYDSSGGGVKNRVIEIQCSTPLISDGNKTASLVRENYGYAGKHFIDIIKQQDLRETYRSLQKQVMEASKTTEKQAMAMALILLADGLTSTLMFRDNPINADDVAQYLISSSTVDTSERSHEFIINHIAQNASRFSQDAIGEEWGRINDFDVLINKNILQRELKAAGFEFDAIKSKWAEKGYLIQNSTGRYVHQTKAHNIKANYVKLKLFN